jgi:hypothetical protein
MPYNDTPTTMAHAAERAMFGNLDSEDRIQDAIEDLIDRVKQLKEAADLFRSMMTGIEFDGFDPCAAVGYDFVDVMAIMKPLADLDMQAMARRVERHVREMGV